MKLENCMVPLGLTPLLGNILKCKTLNINANGESLYLVPESWLVAVFEQLSRPEASKMNINELNNEKMNSNAANSAYVSVNEIDNTYLPKELHELIVNNNYNQIKAIMQFKSYTLKEVAERYGGASSSANVANLMAKTQEELNKIRPATIKKIAAALDCPEAWITWSDSRPDMFPTV